MEKGAANALSHSATPLAYLDDEQTRFSHFVQLSNFAIPSWLVVFVRHTITKVRAHSVGVMDGTSAVAISILLAESACHAAVARHGTGLAIPLRRHCHHSPVSWPAGVR